MATLVASRKGLDEPLTPIEHARRIAGLAQEKLAQDVLILDMRPVCSYTDFFVLATGQNQRQTKSIWDEVHARLKQDERALPSSVEVAVLTDRTTTIRRSVEEIATSGLTLAKLTVAANLLGDLVKG